jgi:LysR family nitrogen assimilation transcriptional regulator
MDIRQLRYFVSIVDLKSMSKAAGRLHVAQPALSQQIASLEADLDVRLLIRSSRGVDATEAGMTLYRHALSILRQLDDTRRDVKSESHEIGGLVAIGMPTTTAAMLAMPLLRSIRERHPRIRLQLFESLSGYLGELLGSGRLDIAVLFRSAETRDVSVAPLLTEELFFMGNLKGRLRGTAALPITALSGVPLVLPSAAQELRLLVERAFAGAEATLNVIADVDSLPSILGAVAEGLAGTILPHSALGHHDDESTIVYRSLVPALHRTVSVCRLRHMPITSAADAVRKLLVELTTEAINGGKWKGAALRVLDE